MLENEFQPNIEETEVCPKRSKTIKIYAVAAVAAAIVAVLLRTVCLFYFYDMEIGYHSEGFVTSLYKVFCLLSALFFSSAVVFVKRNTAIPVAKPAMRVKDIDPATITMHGWLDQPYTYELYDDDGLSKNVKLEDGIRYIKVDA